MSEYLTIREALARIEVREGNLLTELDLTRSTLAATEASLAAALARIAELEAPPVAPLLKGLMVRNGDAATSPFPPNIEVPWAVLQPDGPTALRHPNPIDKAIESGKPFRVRLLDAKYTGSPFIPTPAWVLAACGSVPVTNRQSGITADVARTWELPYREARGQLMAKLAAEYDGISAIFDTFAMHVYGEPMLRSLGDGETLLRLAEAGFTAAADMNSQLLGLADHGVFRSTRIAFALNPYMQMSLDGQGFRSSVPMTMVFADEARRLFGGRVILGNSSVRMGDGYTTNTDAFYTELAQRGRPLTFQTATWDRLHPKRDDATAAERNAALVTTIEWCLSMGAHAVELPGGHNLTVEQRQRLDDELKANV